MKFLVFALIVIGTGYEAQAQTLDIHNLFEAQMGYGTATTQNPNNSEAEYTGIVLRGLYGYSIYNGETSNFLITANYKLSIMENTSNDASQTQEAKFMGPGVGLMFRTAPFTFGADYNFMKADHNSQGVFTTQTKQDFNTITAYAEYSSSFDSAELGLTVMGEFGTIEKSETGLSKDQDFKAYTILLHFKYDFGASIE